MLLIEVEIFVIRKRELIQVIWRDNLKIHIISLIKAKKQIPLEIEITSNTVFIKMMVSEENIIMNLAEDIKKSALHFIHTNHFSSKYFQWQREVRWSSYIKSD